MGIQVATAISQPAVTFNKVHLTRLNIEQPIFYDDRLQPVYNLVVEYRMFGVDSENNRHYQGSTEEIIIQDFLIEAVSEASKGNISLVNAMESIEKAIASIIQSKLNNIASVI